VEGSIYIEKDRSRKEEKCDQWIQAFSDDKWDENCDSKRQFSLGNTNDDKDNKKDEA
jgi:hypothetical protein